MCDGGWPAAESIESMEPRTRLRLASIVIVFGHVCIVAAVMLCTVVPLVIGIIDRDLGGIMVGGTLTAVVVGYWFYRAWMWALRQIDAASPAACRSLWRRRRFSETSINETGELVRRRN